MADQARPKAAIDWAGLEAKLKAFLEKAGAAAPIITNFLDSLAGLFGAPALEASGPTQCDHGQCCGEALEHLCRACCIVLKHQADCEAGTDCDHAACCCCAQREVLAAAAAINDHCSCCK